MTHATPVRERSPTMRLDPAEPRCEPSITCPVRGQCARYQAQLVKGKNPKDYATENEFGASAVCDGFIRSGSIWFPEGRLRRPKQQESRE